MSEFKRMLRKALAAALNSGARRDDAEDIVQEAFLRIHRYEQDHVIRSKEAMLVTTAVNVSIDEQRKKKTSPVVTSHKALDEIFDCAPGPSEILYAKARLHHAYKGLEQLSEKTRRILLARRLDNVGVSEIAKREGMSVSAVEKQIARATLSLMKWMEGW